MRTIVAHSPLCHTCLLFVCALHRLLCEKWQHWFLCVIGWWYLNVLWSGILTWRVFWGGLFFQFKSGVISDCVIFSARWSFQLIMTRMHNIPNRCQWLYWKVSKTQCTCCKVSDELMKNKRRSNQKYSNQGVFWHLTKGVWISHLTCIHPQLKVSAYDRLYI